MIYDEISDNLDRAAQGTHVFPGSKARIHLRVINGVKSGVRVVNGREKGQQVDSTEDAGQRPTEQAIQFTETTPREAVNIRNELNLVFHYSLYPDRLRLSMLAARRADPDRTHRPKVNFQEFSSGVLRVTTHFGSNSVTFASLKMSLPW